MRNLLFIPLFLFACKTPVKNDTAPTDTDSIVIMAKVAKNADLSKIDLSKVVISSQPISLYSKDIDALKKQNAAQDSIILIMQKGFTGVADMHKKDSAAIGSMKGQIDLHTGLIGSIKKGSDSLRIVIDTSSLIVNLADFSIVNKTLSIKKQTGADTLVKAPNK